MKLGTISVVTRNLRNTSTKSNVRSVSRLCGQPLSLFRLHQGQQKEASAIVFSNNACKVGELSGVSMTQNRSIHLTKKTEEIVTNPENAVWDPVREFHFRKFSIFESLGFDYEDKEADDWFARYYMFVGVSLMSVGMVFFVYYRPSYTRLVHDWGKREAYRLIEEREAQGLPVLEVDYAPVEELLPFLPPEFNLYTCDVETDFTYYDRVYQLYPTPKPVSFNSQTPKILGAFPPEQRLLNDGSKMTSI